MPEQPRKPYGWIIAVATVAALAACDREGASSHPAGPAPYVSEAADGTTVVDHPITRKRHFPPGTWSKDSPDHERWDFCFDQADGGYACIPVSAEDYQRYNVGDRVVLRQAIGQLAVVQSAL